jgi:hypothetical protein
MQLVSLKNLCYIHCDILVSSIGRIQMEGNISSFYDYRGGRYWQPKKK